MDKIHIFCVGSYFHVIVAKSVIEAQNIPLDNVYFITSRSVQLPPCYSDKLLYDETYLGTWERIKYAKRNGKKLKSILEGKKVAGYFTFQGVFPFFKFFDEYNWLEEGFAAYGTEIGIDKNRNVIIRELLISCLLFIMLPFAGKYIRGIVFGSRFGSPIPIKTTFYRLTDKVYNNLLFDKSTVVTIPVSEKPLKQSMIHDSIIVVMDRLTSTGRNFEVNTYLRVMVEFMKTIDIKGKKVYLKLHPADYKYKEAKDMIEKSLGFLNYELIIDEGLEDIASSNNRNIFVGNHSTVLFYAPILGHTNRSICCVKMLANADDKYMKFMDIWGGLDKFCELYGIYVECR